MIILDDQDPSHAIDLVERINENDRMKIAAHPRFLGRSYGTAAMEITINTPLD